MGLSAKQWQFLAARQMSETDKEAAEQVHIRPPTVAHWKAKSAEFTAQYEVSFRDGVRLARDYTRQMLGKAAQRLDEALDAAADEGAIDHRSRLKAIEIAFKTHRLLTDRVEWTPDLSGISDQELQILERLFGRPAPTAD